MKIVSAMKFDHAWHFAGKTSLPSAFHDPGPYALTLDQLAELTAKHAVLIYQNEDGQTVIAFDSHRGRFKQR